MISTLSMIYMGITLCLSLVLPIVFLVILARRQKGVFWVWLSGALGFVVPQLIIRIPMLQFLESSMIFQQFRHEQVLLYILFMALTAGFFETAGRLAVLKGALGKRLSYMTGLCTGAGHGGIESMVLVGVTYVNNLVISYFINQGNLAALIPNDPDMADRIRQSLIGAQTQLFLMAGFERLFTMVIQIALSILLTMLIIRQHAAAGFFLVAIYHAALDFTVMFLKWIGMSSLIIELVIMGFAIVSLVFILKIRTRFGGSRSIPADPGEQAVEEGY